MNELLVFVMPAFGVLIFFQLIDLFFALFHTGNIRRKLKPLNDLAVRAEQLSKAPLDNTKQLEHLEQAIAEVSPDSKNQ